MTISIMRDMRIVFSSILICIQKSFVIFIYKGYIKVGILESKVKKSNASEERIYLYWHYWH